MPPTLPKDDRNGNDGIGPGTHEDEAAPGCILKKLAL